MESAWQVMWCGEPLEGTVMGKELLDDLYTHKDDWEEMDPRSTAVLNLISSGQATLTEHLLTLKDEGVTRKYKVVWVDPDGQGAFLRHGRSGEIACCKPLASMVIEVDMRYHADYKDDVGISLVQACTGNHVAGHFLELKMPILTAKGKWKKVIQQCFNLTLAEKDYTKFTLRCNDGPIEINNLGNVAMWAKKAGCAVPCNAFAKKSHLAHGAPDFHQDPSEDENDEKDPRSKKFPGKTLKNDQPKSGAPVLKKPAAKKSSVVAKKPAKKGK